MILRQIEEVEHVAVDIGPDQERDGLDALVPARRLERERDGGTRSGRRSGPDLHGLAAQIDARRLPLGAVLLVDSNGERDARPRRAATLDGSPRRPLEPFEEPLELIERNGLREDLDCAELEALLRLTLRRAPGHDDDRDGGLSNHREPEEVEPAHAGQPDVEQDQIGAIPLEPGQGVFGRSDGLGPVAEPEAELSQDRADVWIIFDDEHPHIRCLAARAIPQVDPLKVASFRYGPARPDNALGG
ncbi:MAG: hypothetical protein AABZ83_15815 [candidate division NC10 bacterium]